MLNLIPLLLFEHIWDYCQPNPTPAVPLAFAYSILTPSSHYLFVACVSLLNRFKFSPLQPDLATARAIQAETVPDCDLGECDQHGARKPGAPLPPSKPSGGGKGKKGDSNGSVVSSSGDIPMCMYQHQCLCN